MLDVTMPGLDGLELQRRLAAAGESLPIVFVTGHGDIPMSVRAIKAGATDFLTKPVQAQVLVAAVRAAIEQDASVRRARAETAELRRRLASLTPREREVLAALAAGRLNKQIAADLGVVEQTVKFHRARIMERMQAKTVAELMHIAARLGIGAATPSATPAGSSSDARAELPQAESARRATNPKVSYRPTRDAVTLSGDQVTVPISPWSTTRRRFVPRSDGCCVARRLKRALMRETDPLSSWNDGPARTPSSISCTR